MEGEGGKRWKVAVIGGGIAGLSVCYHLLQPSSSSSFSSPFCGSSFSSFPPPSSSSSSSSSCEKRRIDVTLFEANSRLGGRAFTDPDGIDIGASWIHNAEETNPFFSFVTQTLSLSCLPSSDMKRRSLSFIRKKDLFSARRKEREEREKEREGGEKKEGEAKKEEMKEREEEEEWKGWKDDEFLWVGDTNPFESEEEKKEEKKEEKREEKKSDQEEREKEKEKEKEECAKDIPYQELMKKYQDIFRNLLKTYYQRPGKKDAEISLLEVLSLEIPSLSPLSFLVWDYFLTYTELIEGSHPRSLGMLGLSTTQESSLLTKNLCIVGGFGKVVEKMEEKIRENGVSIRMETPVTRVKVAFNNIIINGREGEEEEKYDAIFFCIPKNKYKNITISPQLPEPKKKALKHLNGGTAEKHILQFDSVFWKSSHFSILCYNISFSSMEKITGRPVLFCWISNTNPFFHKEGEFFAELVRKCWKAPFAKLVKFHRSNWGSSQWSEGTYLSPGLGSQIPKDFVSFQSPCSNNRVFFAGEAAGEPYGETSCAFVTGKLAALQFIDRRYY